MSGFEIAQIITAIAGLLGTIFGFVLAWRKNNDAKEYQESLAAVIKGVNSYSVSDNKPNHEVKKYIADEAKKCNVYDKLDKEVYRVEKEQKMSEYGTKYYKDINDL